MDRSVRRRRRGRGRGRGRRTVKAERGRRRGKGMGGRTTCDIELPPAAGATVQTAVHQRLPGRLHGRPGGGVETVAGARGGVPPVHQADGAGFLKTREISVSRNGKKGEGAVMGMMGG